MPVTYSRESDGSDDPMENNPFPNKYEYRVAYKASNFPGTALQVLKLMRTKNLQIRRMFIGSDELQASPDGKRGVFKVVSESELDEKVFESEIKDAITAHYKEHYPKDYSRFEDPMEAIVTKIDTTKRIHFSVQFVSVDKPGVVAELLTAVRNTKVCNCSLGLISLILFPLYERIPTDGPTSFIDIRGFVDSTYLYETLSESGLEDAAQGLIEGLHKKFLTSTAHHQWSILVTHPLSRLSVGASQVVQRIAAPESATPHNYRISYRAPNVPGTALAVADTLATLKYDIRRAFVGETNVATHSPDSKPTARARFNVTPAFDVPDYYPLDNATECGELQRAVTDAIKSHMRRTFEIDDTFVKTIAVNVKEASYPKYYFGVQIRLSGSYFSRRANRQENVSPIRFLTKVASELFSTKNVMDWEETFRPLGRLQKPRMNIERLTLVSDFTGKLHRDASEVGDIMLELRLSIDNKEYWGKDKAFREEFSRLFRQWFTNAVPRFDRYESVKYVGIRSISPSLSEVYTNSLDMPEDTE